MIIRACEIRGYAVADAAGIYTTSRAFPMHWRDQKFSRNELLERVGVVVGYKCHGELYTRDIRR